MMRSVLARGGARLARGLRVQSRSAGGGWEAIARMPPQEWEQEFKRATVGLAEMDVHSVSYEESASRLRELLKAGLLLHTDLRDNPERFFHAHRILAAYAPKLGPGFWIRFTVHYNLCVGSVLGLGTPSQVEQLKAMQEEGKLGCFALTEKLAGVSSGLVVNCTARWDAGQGVFVLDTAGAGSPSPWAGTKNWISQGLVADKAVVVADLKVGGDSKGPHAFFMDLRDSSGKLAPGVELGDMGRKSVGNDLDNAWIAFSGVKLPKEALLARFAGITPEGEYRQKVEGLPVFHMIGQRLFSGRVAVAQAALEFRNSIFASTKRFADGKTCWDPKGPRPLSSLPQLSRLFRDNEEDYRRISAFVRKCEERLCTALREDKQPGLELVEAIAVAKVMAVESSIKYVHALQNEVGSFALMHGSGFEQRDFLTCCKFAEGDSRILMQKLARDRMRVYKKKEAGEKNSVEQELCFKLAAGDGDTYDLTYELADVLMNRIVDQF